MRTVKVRVGAPIHPLTSGREGARVTDIRERTYAAVAARSRANSCRLEDAR